MKIIYIVYLLFNVFVIVFCLSLEVFCCIDIRVLS